MIAQAPQARGPVPVLQARVLVKRRCRMVAIHNADCDLMLGETLVVIGANDAVKSSLIKALPGAVLPDAGEVLLDGKPISYANPAEARVAGIETVYQTLALWSAQWSALSPALAIVDNMFLGREIRRAGFAGTCLRTLDTHEMRRIAREKLSELSLLTIQNIVQAAQTPSGGQHQGVAAARACAFGSRVVILDEPTATLRGKESRRAPDLIQDLRDPGRTRSGTCARGWPIVLIGHNSPHVFEIADSIHIHRLGERHAVIKPKDRSMSGAVVIMTGAADAPAKAS